MSPHTSSRYMQDIGFTDGRIFVGPGDIIQLTAANSVLTRNAAGNFSFVQAVSQTVTYSLNFAGLLMRRIGFFEDTQNAFGSTFGSGLGGFAAGAGSSGTGIPGEAEFPGRPDTIAGMSAIQELLPRTTFKPKGFRVISYDVIYSIGTAALTAHTTRVDSTKFTNNAALVVTSLLATGANGLQTATQANPYVTNVVVTAPTVFTIGTDTEYWIEVSAQTAGTTVFNFYGVDVLFEFNWN